MRCSNTTFAWTKCCSSQQSPDEARLRDGNFDRWDVDQVISVEWKNAPCSCTFQKPRGLRNPQTLPTCQEWIQVPTVVGGPVA